MDNKILNEIRGLIAEIVREEIKKMTNNLETVYDGEIVQDADGVLSLSVKDSEYALGEIPNLSGQDLENGTAVRVYAKGDRMTDAYIGTAWTQPV